MFLKMYNQYISALSYPKYEGRGGTEFTHSPHPRFVNPTD